jgi:hypothetical protein
VTPSQQKQAENEFASIFESQTCLVSLRVVESRRKFLGETLRLILTHGAQKNRHGGSDSPFKKRN